MELRRLLDAIAHSRLTLSFEYWRGETLIARGTQQVAAMRKENGAKISAPLHAELREALKPYGGR